MPATLAASSTTARPQQGEYAEYYHKYIAMVPDGDITDLLQSQMKDVLLCIRRMPGQSSR
jgi:hypothetical protein